MNRLHQLRETFPTNVAMYRPDDGVEFVILDYNSTDGLGSWVMDNVLPAATNLIFAREPSAAHYHASRAKNLCHRLGSGDVLINLDADNFIGNQLPGVLEAFRGGSEVVHGWNGTVGDGTYGRIAIRRNAFFQLGGYDESFHPMGYQDTDLIFRAEAAGMRISKLPVGPPGALVNEKSESIKNCGTTMTYEQMNCENATRSRRNIRERAIIANPQGWGNARLDVLLSKSQ